MAKDDTYIAKDMVKMIAMNVNYLCSMINRGAISHYNIEHYKEHPRKEATQGAIHHQIVTLRNMLLELDRAVQAIHNTY